MAVIAAGVHEVDIVIHVAWIAEPAAFVDVKGSGVVEALVGVPGPTDVIEKLGDDIAARADVLDVRFVKLPAVIINLVDLGIGRVEERDVLLEPRGIVAEVTGGDAGLGQNICASCGPFRAGIAGEFGARMDFTI